jgi:hypothetical protein
MNECTSSPYVSVSSSSSNVAVCRDTSQCSVRSRFVIPGEESPCKDSSGFESMAAGKRSRKERMLRAQYVNPPR